MRHSFRWLLILGMSLIAANALTFAGDDNEEAVKKDRKLYEGTWRVVSLEVNGNKGTEEDINKIVVINGDDGTWTLRSEDKEVAKGTSTIYPTQKPKTIDLMPTEGDSKGQVILGIYELNEKTRKLCIAPAGKARPTEFKSESGSEHILVTFEREKVK